MIAISRSRRTIARPETRIRTVLSAVLLTLLIPGAARAASGDLDLSFGQGGYAAVQTNRACLRGCVEFGGSYAEALALQPDGGIVLGGYNSYIGAARVSEEVPGALVRLRPNGTLDTSFGGSGGIVDTPFQVTEIHANAQGGLRVSGDGEQGFGVQRYTSTGTLDGFYGTHGVRWLPRFEGQRDRAGRAYMFTTFLVPATDYAPAVEKTAITRLLPSGEQDMSFGHHGYLSLPQGDVAGALALQQDGSVLLTFATERGVQAPELKPRRLYLERLTPRGQPDRTFGRHGVVRVPLKGSVGSSTIVSTHGGEVRIVGSEQRGGIFGDYYLFQAAYAQTGRLDREFGQGGVTHSRMSHGPQYDGVSPLAITFDASRDMIVAGRLGIRTVDTPAGDGFLARFTPHGRDCSFGVGGVVINERMGAANAVALQPDGRIVVAGWGGGFLAARYMGGGRPHACAGEPTR